MLTAAVALSRAWLAAGGPEPALVAGHSLGEYSALAAAGALTLVDAVRIVRVRADAMHSAVPVGVGAMAAVLGLDDTVVKAGCAQAAAGGDQVEAGKFHARPEERWVGKESVSTWRSRWPPFHKTKKQH